MCCANGKWCRRALARFCACEGRDRSPAAAWDHVAAARGGGILVDIRGTARHGHVQALMWWGTCCTCSVRLDIRR